MKIGYTKNIDPTLAVKELKEKLSSGSVESILYFCSPVYDQAELAKAFKSAYPEATVFGCSTAGELISGHMLQNAVVAMAFDRDTLDDYSIQVVENLSLSLDTSLNSAIAKFEEHFNSSILTLPINEYVGIVLIDGLSRCEEKLMEKIGDKTDLIFVGGSSGDDLRFQEVFVHFNGAVYRDAAILALLKPRNKFDIVKTQSFDVLDTSLVATKVNEEKRQVLEFNNKPATIAYAEAVGCDVSEVTNYFMTNPVSLIADGEPFVRSPQRVEGDTMYFYCNILEGAEVKLLQSTDIVEDSRKILASTFSSFRSIDGIVNFNCILRTLELEKNHQTQEYVDLFALHPMIGFNTYGEEYLGHINQTSTMLVFHQ